MLIVMVINVDCTKSMKLSPNSNQVLDNQASGSKRLISDEEKEDLNPINEFNLTIWLDCDLQ